MPVLGDMQAMPVLGDAQAVPVLPYLRAMPVLGGIGEALFLDEVTEAQLQEALSFVYSYSSGRMAEIRSAYGRTPEVKSA